MAGHISYPRTAAAESAWNDYRDAISLANAGSLVLAISLLLDILADPNAPPELKQAAAELLARLNVNAEREASRAPPTTGTDSAPPPSGAAPGQVHEPAAPPAAPPENSPPDSNPLVPQGGLGPHETVMPVLRGHTLEKHVANSLDYLKARTINEKGKDVASTFLTREDAERFTSANIDGNEALILDWLNNQSRMQLRVEIYLNTNTGLIYERRSGTVKAGNGVRTVLRRNPSMPLGYHIHTSFPEDFE